MPHQPNHPFIVGEKYLDRRGEYTVIGLDGDHISIRYDDGTEAQGNIAIRARIFQNILNEHKAFHPIQTDRYFFLLGFLAAHSEFNAEVPPQSQASFEQDYSQLTGTQPVLHADGYFPIEIETTWDKWGAELRIYFPEPGATIDLPPQVDPRPGNAPGVVRINNNRFWWTLVRIGFRLGKVHDVGKIRSSILPKFQPHFDAGLHA